MIFVFLNLFHLFCRRWKEEFPGDEQKSLCWRIFCNSSVGKSCLLPAVLFRPVVLFTTKSNVTNTITLFADYTVLIEIDSCGKTANSVNCEMAKVIDCLTVNKPSLKSVV